MFCGPSFTLGASLAAGWAAGAVSGRVGDGAGEVFEGVTVLLELGVSVTMSFGTVFARARPRNDRNDLLDATGSSLAGSSGNLEVSVFGCSSSLNWAGSGCDCDGVSETATSPTTLCATAPSLFTSSFGCDLNQNAQPVELD